MSMRRVCIVQPVMKSYRRPFFHLLHERLRAADVDLVVAYGQPWAAEALRGDNVDLESPPGLGLQSRMIGGRLLWIPAWAACRSADAVIVEHANKHLLNYPLALASCLSSRRLAYWGHGRDRQADPASRGERFKRHTLHWADWWFAYTAGAADYVAGCAFPRESITVVENAIDTAALRADLAAVTPAMQAAALTELGLPTHGRRLVYCGSLYGNKRLDLLMAAADIARASMPDLQLIIIGGGPQEELVTAYADQRDWVAYAGPRFGSDKAVLLSLGELWLNPGLVGLGILDAFCAGLPVLTTNLPVHSPEIEYLEHGVNGLMLAPDAGIYAEQVVALLTDDERLAALRAGAMACGRRYSVETMADNFSRGVLQWLNS